MGHRDLLVTRTYRQPTPNARPAAREASAVRLSSSQHIGRYFRTSSLALGPLLSLSGSYPPLGPGGTAFLRLARDTAGAAKPHVRCETSLALCLWEGDFAPATGFLNATPSGR